MAFIIAVAVTCVLIVKGGNRFTDDGDSHGDGKDGEE